MGRYYCMPPKARGVDDENAELAEEAQVVTSYDKELDIEALFRGEASEWEGLHSDGKAIAMTSGAFGTIGEEGNDDEDEDDAETEGKVMIDEAPKKRKGGGDDYD